MEVMIRKKKKAREWLYLKYKKEHEAAEERIELAESLGMVPDMVVIKKISFFGKLTEKLFDIASWVVRIVFTVVILGLLSFAVTILINERLRTAVFEIIKLYF